MIIDRHLIVFPLFKILKHCLVFTLNPASLIEGQRFPPAFCIVLMLKTVLNHLKLQSTHRSNDFTAIKLTDK